MFDHHSVEEPSKLIVQTPEFSVRAWQRNEYYAMPDEDAPTFFVDLPHSCDEWVIAEAGSLEDAIEEFDRFIAECLRVLENMKEYSE